MNQIMQLYRDNANQPKQVTNLLNKADTTASLYVYDMISADWGVSALAVIDAINQAGDAAVLNVHINSPGGDVFEGRAIMAAISAFRGKTVAKIDALCASAATSIALACDEIEMAEGAAFMIHNAKTLAYGDKSDLRHTADVVEKIEGAIVNDYTTRTGKDEAEIRAAMQAETWFTAAEALEYGFVDRVTGKTKVKNTWNLAAFKNAPAPEPEPPPEPKNETTEPATQAGFFMAAANANRLRLAQIA